MRDQTHHGDAGFTLVELLVVIVIVGILAAVGFPRLIDQRRSARDAQAVSDLRNLIPVELGIEADTGSYSADPNDLAAWEPTEGTVVCAFVNADQSLSLAAWHPGGRQVFTWSSTDRLTGAASVPFPADCQAEIPGSTQVS